MSEHINTNNTDNTKEDMNMETSEITTCAHCGCVIEPGQTQHETGDGDIICDDCRNRFYAECADCGELFLVEDMTETSDGLVCESCLEDDYSQCDFCGEYHRNDDLYPVNENFLYAETQYACEWCVDHDSDILRCSDCGELVTNRYVWGNDGDRVICDRCCDDWCMCPDCERIIHSDYVTWDEENDEYVCDECYSRRSRRRYINDYNFKPLPIFCTKAGKSGSHDTAELTFGVELEMDDGDDSANECAGDLCNMPGSDVFYIKHDGSVAQGLELVTHPCSLAYHMEDYPWNDIIRIAREHGFKSHDPGTCGLHVHVGRKQIVDMSGDDAPHKVVVGRIMFLLAKYEENFVKFSRRTRGQLNNWAKFAHFDGHEFTKQAVHDKDRIEYLLKRWHEELDAGMCDSHSLLRYHALNLCNSSTIEFRFARGSLKRETIMATLQMYSNIVLLAMHTKSTDINDITWNDIVTYNKYDELKAYLSDRFSDTEPSEGIVLDDAEAQEQPANMNGQPTERITLTRRDDCRVEWDDEVFHVGDRVVNADNPDEHGTIVCVNGHVPPVNCAALVGVAWDTDTYHCGHNLGGYLPEDAVNGWWMRVNNLRHTSENLSYGQQVICSEINGDFGDSSRVDGLVGTVYDDSGESSPFVVYPGLGTGHNNARLAPDGYENSGWYTSVCNLLPYVREVNRPADF